MSTLATGILAGQLDWSMLGIGALLGLVLVIIDEILKRTTRSLRLPPLAVALGIYLPVTATVPCSIGALVALLADLTVARRARALGRPIDEYASAPRRRAMLLGSGMIVGESLFGIANALLIVKTGDQNALALVGDSFQPTAEMLGGGVFLLLCLASYRWIIGKKVV
jgi:putative OPT family oligopeptide transporter